MLVPRVNEVGGITPILNQHLNEKLREPGKKIKNMPTRRAIGLSIRSSCCLVKVLSALYLYTMKLVSTENLNWLAKN